MHARNCRWVMAAMFIAASGVVRGQATAPAGQTVKQLLADMDADSYKVREAASQAVGGLDASALPELRKALGGVSSEEGRARLEMAIAMVERRAARIAAVARKEKERGELERYFVKAYGAHPEKRADEAEVIGRYFSECGLLPRLPARAGAETKALRTLKELEKANVDEPLLNVMMGSTWHLKNAWEIAVRVDVKATAKELDAAEYSSAIKAYGWAVCVNSMSPKHLPRKGSERECAAVKEASEIGWKRVLEGFKEKDAPRELLEDSANVFVFGRMMGAGEVEGHSEFVVKSAEGLRAIVPKGDGFPDELAGRQLYECALTEMVRFKFFEGRVEPNAKARELLERSANYLEKAWERSPDRSGVALALVNVQFALGSGEDVLDRWTERALRVDPDCRAHELRLRYLGAEFGGGEEARRDYVKKVAEGAHVSEKEFFFAVEFDMRDAEGFPKNEKMWEEVDATFSEYLQHFPKDHFRRTQYACAAAMAKKWEVAGAQFKILGNDADERGGYAPGAMGMLQERTRAALAGELPEKPVE